MITVSKRGLIRPVDGYFRCDLSPRVNLGVGEGPGEECVVKFAHKIIREEGPKSRKMGSPWSSQL
jgi:hypothetical protein